MCQTIFVFQNTMKCPTCFELLISDSKNYIVTSPCGHLFHNDCVQAWLDRGNQSCPQCRTGLTREKLIRLYSFETTADGQTSHGTNLNKQKSQSLSILYTTDAPIPERIIQNQQESQEESEPAILYTRVTDSVNMNGEYLNFLGHPIIPNNPPTSSATLAPLYPLASSNPGAPRDINDPTQHTTNFGRPFPVNNNKTNCSVKPGGCFGFVCFWIAVVVIIILLKGEEVSQTPKYHYIVTSKVYRVSQKDLDDFRRSL